MNDKKQQYIDGTEPPSIPEIDRAASEYVRVRDRRMDLTEDEVELRGKLMQAMVDAKLESYVYDGNRVTLTHEDKVKVKKADAPKVEV